MPGDLVAEMRERARRQTLAEFMDWFSVATWELPDGTDEPTRALVGDVLLCWAEYTNGHRTEEELRALLL